MEWSALPPPVLTSLLTMLLILSAQLLEFAKGEIACICDTPDCREVGKASCFAKYHCFAEYQLDETGLRFLPSHRGCINERTPLNCVRQLPHVKNSHLRTLCCQDSWCNQPAKIPKFIRREKIARKKPIGKLGKPRPRPRTEANLEPDRPGVLQAPLNPMRIAAPIAAACIVLSFIIFVIFLIKRRESQQALNDLVYGDYDPALLAAALGSQVERCERPVLNPRLYNPFLKAPVKATV